ncbi:MULTISPECIES: sugar ABC transporter permease [unclassified Actinomyces]|uniref:carbohydrate ABC transporter permease n=1 Tax=unclassified Actinomyces TaxID=2609248 RepID=UPI00201772B8|nr:MULTISPECIES: sugar ABC transporter permease [unclassified Actinomyces]MCL3777233.1 sugar ABC transporter permease [Actinomyces sp. AC-20-1]MCL3790373.1 sugar ABC transporter permease [Actinomyces sp. 187325]MCL3792674.1 sugar ABC transporter permease [Actinomyces sp. 186855]MCL3795162.1 sugar ABC transporter permease [Actinomyces sp. 217892]
MTAQTTPPATAGPPRRRLSTRRSHVVVSIALLALPVLVYALFMLYPLARVVQLSFYRWDGLSLGTWVGLDNYRTTFTDERLVGAFAHALVLIVFYALLPLAIGLVLASLLARSEVRGTGFFRTVVFLPQVIAMVVLAVSWRRIYAPDGLLNSGLRLVGLDALTRSWLGDFDTALVTVGLIGTWVSTGLVTVLLMSGIAGIPKDYYEAATLDGAGWWRRFWHVTVPGVRAEILVSLTLTVIAALKTFDLVYVTTSGGPGTSTTVPSYEVYNQAFRLGQVGTASSLAVVLTLVIFVINLTINLLGERER